MATEEEDEAGIPEWVVTFGDMMSLLLTFFIMLVSMSEIKEEERFQAMVESFRRQFGHTTSMTSLAPGKSKPRNSAVTKLASLGRANRFDLMSGGDKARAPEGDYPRVRVIRPGAKTGIGTVIFFDPGSAALSGKSKADLQQGMALIEGKPQVVEIRGHTDNVGSDKDNLALSMDRAFEVKGYLEEQGIDGRRVTAKGYGESDPVASNETAEGRAQNRRTEFVIK